MNCKKIFLLFLVVGCFSLQFADSPTAKTRTKRAAAVVSPEIKAAAHAAAATGCDNSLWQHVYHPARLQVVEKCIEVTGTIHHLKKEADGDDHIQVKVDPPFDKLLNARNISVQAACLVVEPVCESAVTQTDAVAACKDFHSPVRLPGVDQHVKIRGSFILDTEANHGWTEIHPVTSIIKQ
ncbi:MAG TPA: hypothetical protein VNS63_10830 [Blastocatellia bacterium]|nr:hypothetical protein [Blastocatellia bacterium]